jgi:DNA-binding transcriptional LysR family regulator
LVTTFKDRTPEQAIKSDYVYVDWGVQFASEHDAKYGRHISPKLVTSTGRIALDYLLARGGSAYLPTSIANPFIESGELFKIGGKHTMKRIIYAVYHKNNPIIDTIESVIDLIDTASPERPVIMDMIASN